MKRPALRSGYQEFLSAPANANTNPNPEPTKPPEGSSQTRDLGYSSDDDVQIIEVISESKRAPLIQNPLQSAKPENERPPEAKRVRIDEQTVKITIPNSEIEIKTQAISADLVIDIGTGEPAAVEAPKTKNARRKQSRWRSRSKVKNSEDRSLEALSDNIWQHYERNKQTKEVYEWKVRALADLSSALVPVFGDVPFHMFPVGSTVNLLGSYNADMDVCLVVITRDRWGREIVCDDCAFARNVLYSAANALRGLRNVRRLNIIPARVPIIRLMYTDRVRHVEVDINCNNLPGIRNSHLLHYYALVDDRLPALALVIKHWAIRAGVNDAADGTLSSYSLILMIIHYLQYGVLQTYSYATRVLPNLQELYPRYFTAQSDVRALQLHEKLDIKSDDVATNRPLSVGELLLGFFNYYANYFSFETSAASIRTAGMIKKDKLVDIALDKTFIGVEEPYERTNVARAVCREVKYRTITKAFKNAYEKLHQKLTLGSIGVVLR